MGSASLTGLEIAPPRPSSTLNSNLNSYFSVLVLWFLDAVGVKAKWKAHESAYLNVEGRRNDHEGYKK